MRSEMSSLCAWQHVRYEYLIWGTPWYEHVMNQVVEVSEKMKASAAAVLVSYVIVM